MKQIFKALIVILLLFAILIGGVSANSIHIYTKKVEPPGYSTKSTIEVYVMPIGLFKPTGTLVCTVYEISERTLEMEDVVKTRDIVNVTTTKIESDTFDKPVCKIARNENANIFQVFNFPTDIVRKRGTIMDPDGPMSTTYKHLLVNVTITNDTGKTISDQQLLYSVDGYIIR